MQGMYSVLEPLVSQQQNERVVVDITTFTHEQLLILMGLLRPVGVQDVEVFIFGGGFLYDW